MRWSAGLGLLSLALVTNAEVSLVLELYWWVFASKSLIIGGSNETLHDSFKFHIGPFVFMLVKLKSEAIIKFKFFTLVIGPPIDLKFLGTLGLYKRDFYS